MNEPWGHDAKLNKSVTKRQNIWFHIYELLRVITIIETECRMADFRGWGEGKEGLLFNEFRVSVYQD